MESQLWYNSHYFNVHGYNIIIKINGFEKVSICLLSCSSIADVAVSAYPSFSIPGGGGYMLYDIKSSIPAGKIMLNPRGNHVTLPREILVDDWSQVKENFTWSFPRGLHVRISRGINDLNPRWLHVDIPTWNQQYKYTMYPRWHSHVGSTIVIHV